MDIVVCDGFVGNVALKASEGVASMVIGGLKTSFLAILDQSCCDHCLSGS